jgi:nucleoside-diphosphate-sugar epimerase
MAQMRVLIVGCGFVGLPLAMELIAQGHHVVGIRRSPAGAAAMLSAGVEPFLADISRADFVRPPGRFDWVIFTAAASRSDAVQGYRAVYVDGLRQVLAQFTAEPPAKIVYTSSTSVYGQQDGSWVKETSPTEPRTATANVLLEAEGLVLATPKAGVPAVVLRVAGIYGADRLPLLDRFLKNETRIEGRGARHLNMIHRDDVVSAILAALRNGRAGECYNVVDHEPVTEVHFYTWMAETLGKWMPPSIPAETDPGRVREAVDRKVSNRRLTMELGCRLKHPNFRLGYTAEFKRLTDAGLLEITPEER